MKKLMIPVAAGALAVALASCGSNTDNNSSGSSGSASSVLMDSSGLALYSPDNESASNVRCIGACTQIWKPVRPGALKAGDVGKLAVITRPDGSKQLSAAGKPLYTFAQDKPGAINGNGASDAFGKQTFTWHVVQAKGAAPAQSAPMPSGY
jgi:predicted lipoprotein with Yx(FWY)xxD motif